MAAAPSWPTPSKPFAAKPPASRRRREPQPRGPGEWRPVLSAAADEPRRFIETLHPELLAEPHVETVPVHPETQSLDEHVRASEPAAPAYAPPSLHEVVERIQRRRRLRAEQSRPDDAAAAIPQEAPALFRWECGPGGEIAWVEGAPRGAVIGRSIARSQDGG